MKEVVHVYGQLGTLPGLTDKGSAGVRDYEDVCDTSDLRRAADGIRIVSERNESAGAFEKAKTLIKAAEEVVCLGFGWDQMNMERIGLRAAAQGAIFGTTYEMSPAEVRSVENSLGDRVNQLGAHEQEAYMFLRSGGCLGLPVMNADDFNRRRLIHWK